MKIIIKENFKDEPERIINFKEGGMWEEKEWSILFNKPIYDADRNYCRHCGERFIVRCFRQDGSHYDNVYAICPRVVAATNEGGFNSTGVCLDCILEGEKF